MIRKLRIKFICMTMVLVTVLLTAMMGMQYRSTKVSLEQSSLRVLQASTLGAMPNPRPGMAPEGMMMPCFMLMKTQWGDLIVSGSEFYDLTDTEMLLEIYTEAENSGLSYGEINGYNLRFLRDENMMGVRYVFMDITSEKATLNALLRNCILIGAVSFCAFLLVAVLLSRWMIRPVEQAWKQQRQFVADASHELKTPLTVILTNAELMQDETCEEAARRQFADNILAMSHQMRGLVESLLQLARADSGQTRAEITRLDYSALVADAVLPFEPLYFEQGLMLESSVEEGITLSGSESHLRQVVEILLDNGRKYSASGGTVWLDLRRQGRNQCLLRVATPGQELTAQQRSDIFKRFYRTDEVRSMNHSYGLGLPIAQRIVEDHKGKIWAETKPGYNVFCITLPVMGET